MSVLPILPQGFVVGRILTSRGDSADADKLADTAVVVGMVDFTPATAYRKLDAFTAITHSKITAKLDSHGDLHPQREASDSTGSDTEDGVWLPTGTWTVTYRLNTGFGALPEHHIEVTAAHTEAAPLPLFANLGDPAPAGATFVQLSVPLGGQQGQVLVMNDGSLSWGTPSDGGGGIDTEAVQDIVGSMVTGAGGTYNDAAGTITLPSGGGGYPVQHVIVTASQAVDPTGWPTDQIVTVYYTQDATGGWVVTLPASMVNAYNVGFTVSLQPGSETVAQFRYSTGLAKWVCEGCWVSIAGGVPTDIAAPAAGTLGTSATHEAITLTVSGASDETALHATPYGFTINGGSTWSAWQASNVYAASGLTVSTSYPCNWRVRDAAGNVTVGTQQTVTTSASADSTPPVWSATFTLGTPTTTKVIVTASAQATDNIGVDHYEVSYNGGTDWSTIAMGGGWTFQLTGTAGTTYSNTQMRAVDAAGNTSTPVLSVPSYTMAAEQAILVSDTFNRADQTGLGNADTGHTWALLPDETATLPNISGNTAAKTWSGGAACLAYIEAGQSDMTVQVTPQTTLNGFQLKARVTDFDNHYKWSGSDKKFFRKVAGVEQAVGVAYGGTVESGDTIGITCKEEGSATRLLLLVNGVQVVSLLDSNATRPTGTKAGFSPGYTGTPPLKADNFEVREA